MIFVLELIIKCVILVLDNEYISEFLFWLFVLVMKIFVLIGIFLEMFVEYGEFGSVGVLFLLSMVMDINLEIFVVLLENFIVKL